ncbi:hypothetical protein A1O7_03412 [Cladophialophora yegresii CBS 114405]|uniref:C2H2-type domain-containing protein n=1 Tax=Cladophialophora yegresii CBS 114405 TaxID=1182544 RepID=W9W4U3_9EURO|nr:uncharacterized protein A1O7_03412 [Cladophialophora yegresii CBS 114405]EXJ62968.1 hypothetical protein A1O7_03412 [Cladophialophora yegresii CBS 114405]
MDIHGAGAAGTRIQLSAYRPRPASPRSTSRSNSQTSDDPFQPRQPIVIPGIRFDDVPPPLPPPAFNDDLANGVDLAWNWANSHPFEGQRQLAPIKPGSSLHGSFVRSRNSLPHGRDDDNDNDDDDMSIDDDKYPRRSSNVSTVRSPSQAEMRFGGSVPAGRRKPPSPNLANQRLQGEVPLARRNYDRSAQAYDQRLLSKIGKCNSPPQHQRSGSTDGPSYASQLSLQTVNSKFRLLSATELPSALVDPVSKWITSPVSAGISPGSRPGWRDYNMEHRSPSIDNTAHSLVLDPELFLQPRAGGLPSISGATPNDEVASVGGRSYRSSYDPGFFAETESDVVGDDQSAFRNLNLGDSQEQQVGRRSSKQGMKRRAGSPPSEVARDDKSPSRGGSSTEVIHHKVPTTALARSPGSRYYQPKHGSVSSTASSVRHNSYASSVALSIAGSSMTSISSFERQSPLDPASQTAYITSAQPIPSPAATSVVPSRTQPTQPLLDTKSAVRKLSTHIAMSDSMLPPATRVGNYFICDCCPKKPKKFDAEEGLRAHQMEKQYTCQYCNNRFKNKNEAERHQNSLHLRRHSWSCAAISNYQAAFHPVSSPPGSAGAQADVCGYCGEEFPNLPQPDWDRRIDHLTNIHKFGECNQAKKFFRADHFRQHLKHSHAGQSGKWTNVLENVCLREEVPQDLAGISPTGSDSSPGRGPSSLPERPMGGATINEAQDET